MSHYYIANHHKFRQKVVKGTKAFFFVSGLILLVVIGAFVADVLNEQNKSQKTADSTIETRAVYLPSSQVFRNAYFQFQAAQNWRLVASETTASKFVYRSYNKTLVLQELIFLVNESDASHIASTRVLPVTLSADGVLEAGKLSDHCKNGMPPVSVQPNPRLIIFEKVEVYCNPSSTDFAIKVGIPGKSPALVLKRPNGQTINLQIYFKDVTFSPNEKELVNMIPTIAVL